MTLDEKKAAQQMLKNIPGMKVLEKTLLPNQNEWIAKIPLDASNERWGEHVKACLLADQMIRERLNEFQQLSQEEMNTEQPIAPE